MLKKIIIFIILNICISINLQAYDHEKVAEDIFYSIGMEEWYYEFTYEEDGETYYFKDLIAAYSYVLSDPDMTIEDYNELSTVLYDLIDYITSNYDSEYIVQEPYSTYILTLTLMAVYLEVRVNIFNNYNQNTKDIINFLMFDYEKIKQNIPKTWRKNMFCKHVDKQLNIIFNHYIQYGNLKAIDFKFWEL